MLSGDDRGQIQTIEAFIAAIILITVLVIVVQATSVTPLTTSFTNQHVKYEFQNMGQDVLSSLDEMPSQLPALAIDTTPSKLEKSIGDWLEGDYGALPLGARLRFTATGIHMMAQVISGARPQPIITARPQILRRLLRFHFPAAVLPITSKSDTRMPAETYTAQRWSGTETLLITA